MSWFPNPFDSRTGSATIVFDVPSAIAVSIDIFSVFGRRVRTLTISAAAGTNTAAWDGTDSAGRKLSKGVYVAVVRAGGESATYKVGVIH
jgi:flagellar hook assembly protein FlgD